MITKSPTPNSGAITNTSTTAPAPSSPISAGGAQTRPSASSPLSTHNFVPTQELERRSASPSHIDSPMEDDVDIDLMKGFPAPNTLEGDEPQLTSAYAAETRNVLGAEAFIAERRYRQILMAAHSYKRRMLKARLRFKKASDDVVRIRNSVCVDDNIEQPTSELAAAALV